LRWSYKNTNKSTF